MKPEILVSFCSNYPTYPELLRKYLKWINLLWTTKKNSSTYPGPFTALDVPKFFPIKSYMIQGNYFLNVQGILSITQACIILFFFFCKHRNNMRWMWARIFTSKRDWGWMYENTYRSFPSGMDHRSCVNVSYRHPSYCSYNSHILLPQRNGDCENVGTRAKFPVIVWCVVVI